MTRSFALFATIAILTSVATARPPSGPRDKSGAPKTSASARSDDAEHVAPDAPRRNKRRIVGILDVRVEGVPPEIERQFQSDLEEQLDSRAYWLAPQQRVREMMSNSTKWTEGCVVGPCLHDIRIQTGAEIVLLASITGSGTSFGYIVTLMRTDTGRLLDQDASRCEVCTVNEVLTSATRAAAKLLTAVPDKLPDEASAASAELALATTKLEAAHSATKRRRRTLGIALTVTGAIVAGAAMSLYFVLDRPAGALVGAGLGGGLVIGGIATMTF